MIRIKAGLSRTLVGVVEMLIVSMLSSALIAEVPDRTVMVVGWKANVDKAHVQVMDAEGNELGIRDLRGIVVKGSKPWITSYDFIAVAPGLWVQASSLDLRFCEADNGPEKGRNSQRPTGAFGSGNGC